MRLGIKLSFSTGMIHNKKYYRFMLYGVGIREVPGTLAAPN